MQRGKIRLFIFCNLIYFLYGLHYTIAINNFILSILINLIIFIVPGIAWTSIFNEKLKDAALLIFFCVCFSLMVLTLGLAGQHVLRIEPTSFSMFIYLFIVTNLSIILLKSPGIIELAVNDIKRNAFLLLVSFLVYGFIYYGAVRILPHRDLDGEHQGTAYGLIYKLKPYLTSDELPVNFYFCHPPFTNLYNAWGILFFDKIKEFKYYYDSAKAAEKILESKPGINFSIELPSDNNNKYRNIKIANINNDYFLLEGKRLSRQKLTQYISDNNYSIFLDNPNLLGARMFDLFVTVLIYWILFKLTLYLTNSMTLGLLSGFLYVASPGIFYRSCLSEHLPFTNYLSMVFVYQYIVFNHNNKPSSKRGLSLPMFILGFLVAVVNQKTLILLVAFFLMEIIFWIKGGARKIYLKYIVINNFTMGYLSGVACVWIYGLLLDKNSLILSYFRMHFLDRVIHYQTMYSDYPDIWGLWRDFNIEFPMLPVSIIAAVFLSRYIIKERAGVLILWFFLGAFSFTLVDWKQTNHLMCIVPASVVISSVFISKQKGWCKWLFLSGALFVLIYTLWFDINLANNIEFYMPQSGW